MAQGAHGLTFFLSKSWERRNGTGGSGFNDFVVHTRHKGLIQPAGEREIGLGNQHIQFRFVSERSR